MRSPTPTVTTRKDRQMIKSREVRWMRLIIGAAVLWMLWAGAATWAQEPSQGVAEVAQPAEPADLWTFTKEVFSNLFNSRALMDTLAQPKYFILSIIALNVIIFTETGLFF